MAVAVLVCALVQFAITSTVIALPNGRPLTFRWLEATNIYDLEGEAKRIGNQWGFVARESTDGKQYGDAKFYATELKPPEKFQPIYIEGELHFNPVGDIVLPDDADDLTNRIMHAMPLVEETSE